LKARLQKPLLRISSTRVPEGGLKIPPRPEVRQGLPHGKVILAGPTHLLTTSVHQNGKKWATLYEKYRDPLPSNYSFKNRISRQPFAAVGQICAFPMETQVGGGGGSVSFSHTRPQSNDVHRHTCHCIRRQNLLLFTRTLAPCYSDRAHKGWTSTTSTV